MKTRGTLNTVAVLVFSTFASLTPAQCPQNCDATYQNTALGINALPANGGNDNVAIGFEAMASDTTGFSNIAIGSYALDQNTEGSENVAVGGLGSNVSGNNNTAVGSGALYFSVGQDDNTAVGYSALFGSGAFATGFDNTAVGSGALESYSSGSYNTAIGFNALLNNSNGSDNAALGVGSLKANVSGSNNVANGYHALYNNTGSNNIAVGASAGSNLTTGSNNIDIGASGISGDSNTIRIGKQNTQTAAYIQGISGVTVASGVGVIVNSSGHLGTSTSSARFKENIQPMDKASEAILSLKPVSFRYKKELDPNAIPQFGLVAEQVEKVDPDLVARDDQGKAYSVRYEAVNAMLLNEFLKAHRKIEEQSERMATQDRIVQEQQATIAKLETALAQQRKDFAQQESEIKALTASLQKARDQFELMKPATRVVVANTQ